MKINISNVVKNFCTIFLLGLLAVSCRKDPIFHIISTETAPIPPLIQGSPTNMVVFKRECQVPINPIDPTDPDAEPEYETKPIKLLFVASGKLHWYGGTDTQSPGWDRNYGIPQPGGKIIALAVTGEYLYALCLRSNSLSTTLRYIGHNGDWDTVNNENNYPSIQSIYSTYSDGDTEPGQLFAGARKGSNTYALLYLEETSHTLKILKEKTEKTDETIEMLSGAVCRDDVYYLCTRGSGIFRIDKANLKPDSINENTLKQLNNIRKVKVKIEPEIDPDPPPDPDPGDPEPKFKFDIQEANNTLLFMGMIRLNNTIIAIQRDNGNLYEILTDADLDELYADVEKPSVSKDDVKNGLAFSQIFYIDSETKEPTRSARTGGWAMGCLALWEGVGKKILVAGRQGTLFSTSYNNGYREFLLKDDYSFDKTSNYPYMITVDSEDRYSTSLEKHPINHLFQTPEEIDPERTFFASTQTGGLWSYRDRPNNGGWQWNAEN